MTEQFTERSPAPDTLGGRLLDIPLTFSAKIFREAFVKIEAAPPVFNTRRIADWVREVDFRSVVDLIPLGEAVRDIEVGSNFWSVQAITSYLYPGTHGQFQRDSKSRGIVHVFMENIRRSPDINDDMAFAQRTLAHEILHSFLGPHGNIASDSGLMSYLLIGADPAPSLTFPQFAKIWSTVTP